MGNITLGGFNCERCGHTWPPKRQTAPAPKVCPKCKSPYWNVPRKQKKPQNLSTGLHDALSKATNKG